MIQKESDKQAEREWEQEQGKRGKVKIEEGTEKDGAIYFELDKLKQVCVKKFKGKSYVDIRTYYEKDGKVLPTQKGVCLNLEQWEQVKEYIVSIDAAVERI